MDDESIRYAVVCTFVLAALALFVAAWVYRVQGIWSDGQKQITLQQFGPLVWGRCIFETGMQRFTGYVAFGFLTLHRRDYGDDHLRSLGFKNEHLRSLQGARTGFFKLRLLSADKLSGYFFGRTFTARAGEMVPTTLADASSRSWQRVS